jgi:hypothetical protein
MIFHLVLRHFKISTKFVISCHLFFMVISGIACLTTTLGSFVADNKCSLNDFFKVGIITVRYIIMVIYVSMAGHHILLVKSLAFLILFVNPHFLFIFLQIHLRNLPCLKHTEILCENELDNVLTSKTTIPYALMYVLPSNINYPPDL